MEGFEEYLETKTIQFRPFERAKERSRLSGRRNWATRITLLDAKDGKPGPAMATERSVSLADATRTLRRAPVIRRFEGVIGLAPQVDH